MIMQHNDNKTQVLPVISHTFVRVVIPDFAKLETASKEQETNKRRQKHVKHRAKGENGGTSLNAYGPKQQHKKFQESKSNHEYEHPFIGAVPRKCSGHVRYQQPPKVARENTILKCGDCDAMPYNRTRPFGNFTLS